MTVENSHKSLIPWRVFLGIAVVSLAFFAWMRAGLLDLPHVGYELTLAGAGLANLDAFRKLDQFVRGRASDVPAPSPPADRVRKGMIASSHGDEAGGLEMIRHAVHDDPENLVFANAYRIECFRLRRAFLADAAAHSSLAPLFPKHLERQPIAFFESLAREHPSRETKLSLALAWVDEMLLFPALEIKAPASVEAGKILDSILREEAPDYVPALFARGMNHLHRPARLVWPEAGKYPPDAAAQDLARCIAIGRKFGAGSKSLQARLAIALGDAYVKAGKLDNARSWWQIAQNSCRDADVQCIIRTRYGWKNEEALDRLEEDLDQARSQLDRPMTDLAMMWN